jgi:molybdate transport system substrate-binding protein
MRASFAALFLLAACPAAAQQTLTVLSSNATNALIHELHPAFEKATGWTLHVKFDNSAALKTRIEGGESFDVAVMTSTAISDLAMSGKLAAASRKNIARAGVGMAIHPLATKPDISSLDTLKGALITARSITYVEQGATATVLRAIFAKLGLTELMNAKTVYSVSAAHAVAEKKAELGFTQISEIVNVPGADFAAPLPPEVQVYTTFAAAATPGAPAAALQFITMLAAIDAATIKKVGMEQIPADRLPPIAADRLTPAQREAVDAFRIARGTEISGPFYPLLRSPELMTRTRAMGDYLRYKSALPVSACQTSRAGRERGVACSVRCRDRDRRCARRRRDPGLDARRDAGGRCAYARHGRRRARERTHGRRGCDGPVGDGACSCVITRTCRQIRSIS